MSVGALSLDIITLDDGLQPRVALNEDTIADYAEQIRQGVEFPPVVVFRDGGAHWLADGWHRYRAHEAAGKASIVADVRQGGRRDAILYSVGANAAHGLRRTNADKRRAVTTLLADPEWARWGDREIRPAVRGQPCDRRQHPRGAVW